MTYDWDTNYKSAANTMGEQKPTGVVFGRSEINFRQVTDGTSKVYMVGEKYMSTDNYEDGLDWGDNEPAFSGNNSDTLRITAPHRGVKGKLPLRPDQPGSSGRWHSMAGSRPIPATAESLCSAAPTAPDSTWPFAMVRCE